MTKPVIQRLIAASLAIGVLTTSPAPVLAQVTVYDPWSIAQSIRQVSQQLQQIQQLQAQLNNQAAMLKNVGSNVTAPVLAIDNQATALLKQAQGIGYNSQNVAQQYNQAYPTTMQGMSFAQVAAALAGWQTSSRQTLQQAMATQNQIVQAQGATTSAVNGAVAASQGAAGQTGAIQATNQLLATLSTQLTQLQTILITQGRAAQVAQAQAQATQAAADAEHARAFHGPTPAPIGVTATDHL